MNHDAAVRDKIAERYLLGELTGEERDSFEAHFFTCQDCAEDVRLTSRFVEASKTFSPTHVKVVTERGVVYLMGLVRREEGDAAGQIAATTSGVGRVVKLFEYTN